MAEFNNELSETIISGTSEADNISNIGENVTINAFEGDDIINNYGDSAIINGGDGNNTITNGDPNLEATTSAGHNVKINTGSGDDFIRNNHGTNVQIDSGNGADLIYVAKASDFTVDMGAGDDTIWNDASNGLVNGGDGNDVIGNNGGNSLHDPSNNMTIYGGAGDDSITNYYTGSNVYINGEVGNDTIYNNGENATIDGGEGDDSINNSGMSVAIDAGGGSDVIVNSNFNTTIYGGTGDDTVHSSEAGMVYVYRAGDGNDLIEGFGILETLVIDGAEFTTLKSGDDVLVQVGENTITLKYAYDKPNIVTADEIINPLNVVRNEEENITINGEDSSNWIRNFAGNVTINSGASNDDIYNSGNNVIINDGGGNNRINNAENSNVTINTGGGDDEIYNNYAENTSIDGGAGDDFIFNGGDCPNATINGGAGDDTIENYAANVLFQYSGGNDVINGFRADSTLQIGGSSTYSAQQSGSDILVNVGEGSVLLKNAATLENLYVNGVDIMDSIPKEIYNATSYSFIDGSSSNDTIYNSGRDSTIDGGDGDDGIWNLGANGSINAGTGNDTIDNWGNFATISGGAGDDFIYNAGNHITFQYSAGNDTISGFDSTSTLEIGDGSYSTVQSGNDIIVSVGDDLILLTGAASLSAVNISGNEISNKFSWTFKDNVATYGTDTNTLITVGGVNSAEGFTINGDTVAIPATVLDGKGVSISSGYKLTLASDVATPSTTNANWIYENGTVTYKGAGTTAGYSVSGGQIFYMGAIDGKTFTISGVKDTLGLELNGNIVTVSDFALDNKDVSISDGYGLTLASGIATPSTTNANWSYGNGAAIYKGAATISGYTVNNGQIFYTGASGGETFTITGVNSADDFTINGNTVAVPAAALDNKNVSISDGYNLTLAGDVAPSTTNANWSYGNGTAIYKGAATIAGYSVNDGQIFYTSANGGEAFTITGVNSADGFTINGKTVAVPAAALDGKDVSISSGYNLTLASDAAPSTTNAAWNYGNGTATYTGAATIAGYSVSDGQIKYTSGNGGEAFTVTGVKSAEGLSLDNKTVTIPDTALDNKNISISDGYNLQLASGIAAPTTKDAAWTLDGTTAIYTSAATVAGYSVSGGQINYTAANGGETFTINGVTSTDDIAVNNKVVTVAAKNLGKENVTISGGYTLALGSDVRTPTSKTAGWSKLENGNTAYQTNFITSGYALANNRINYVEAVEGDILAELSGIADDSTPILGETAISLAADNFVDNVAVIQSNVNNFELTAGDYLDKSFTATDKVDNINNAGSNVEIDGAAGNDKISNRGSFVTVSGGKGDDNVSLSGDAGGNTYVYTDGDGKDIIFNFKANDTIQIIGTSAIEEEVRNNDAVFQVGKGSITVRDAAKSNMSIVVIGATAKEIISSNTYTTEGIISNEKIVLPTTLKKPYEQGANTSIIDGSKVKDGVQITGNNNGGTLIGGEGKDTLISGAGDFALTGDAGDDVFIFSGGKDTIADYSSKDKISLGSFDETGYEIDGNDVILNYGEGNELTLVDGKGKDITFAGKKSTVKVYADEGVYQDKKKSLILAPGTEGTFTASGNNKNLIKIDGSQVDNNLQITGNKKANYIVAGNGNTTLDGGKGKDTLVGGEGADVFIYNDKTGNKVIQNYSYEDGDIISLGNGAKIKQVTTKKDNVILKVSSNTITIEDAAQFSFTDDGETKTYNNKMLISGNSVTLSSDFKGTFNFEENDGYNHVSAELSKKAVEIIGDADDNFLTGGRGKDKLRGDANKDTLNGGKGNDSLWGGDDADTFIYQAGTGTDTIYDYSFDDGDLLQIVDKRGREISKGAIKKWSFNGDDLTLSIKGGGKLVLAGVGTSAKIKVNGTEQSF